MFAHLHVHSYYSLMRGTASLETLCQTAVKAGFDRLALTDTNGMYGLINFLATAREHHLKPIVGAFLDNNSEQAVLLAKTPLGYEIISELITARHLNSDFTLAKYFPDGRGQVAVLASDARLLSDLNGRADRYVEVVPGPKARAALRVAAELNIPPVASNAVYLAAPEEYPLHRLLRAIDLNQTLSVLPPEGVVDSARWLKTAREMELVLPNCPEALTNATRLAGELHTEWRSGAIVFPRYRDEERDHLHILQERCRRGIAWRYGETNQAVETRLKKEMELIREKNYVDYFLTVADIVARRRFTCGRGSAAASLVSYLLGITHVDPIKHNLFFERFLNTGRKDPPDIDVDFAWDERDRLIEEVVEEYGPERFGMVANHVGFRARAATREVAKVYGIPPAEIKEVTRRMTFLGRPRGMSGKLENHPKFHGFHLDPPWPEIIELAERLEGFPRHISVHCGGMVLVPDRVSRYVPVQMAPKGVRVIQWEKDQTEDGGLVKIDILGNRSLAVIRDALAMVEKNTGRRIPYENLNPVDDERAIRIFHSAQTMGIFYFESPATRQTLTKVASRIGWEDYRRMDHFHLNVVVTSIIRPASNQSINTWVSRLHGEPWEPPHPLLRPVLEETMGVMVFQEQLSQAAIHLAGFDPAEADTLRKIVSNKHKWKKLKDYKDIFAEGSRRRGVNDRIIEQVWEMVMGFDGYSFCKPHSASYTLVAYKSAFLKSHYPAEFMAGVISNGGGYYSVEAYLSEARRLGLKIVGPDINQSEWRYTGKGDTVRVGFQQVREIRRETVEKILEDRARNGPFLSLDDFLRRIPLVSNDGAALVKSGALDSVAGGLNRPRLFWAVEARVHERSREAASATGSLGFDTLPITVPPLADVSRSRLLRHEQESLGFILSVHPLTLIDFRGRPPAPLVAAKDIEQYVGKKIWTLGWPVTRKGILSKNSELMEFVSFEDLTGIYETVFFPEAYRRFTLLLDYDRPYALQGTVEQDRGAVTLTVHDLRKLSMKRLG